MSESINVSLMVSTYPRDNVLKMTKMTIEFLFTLTEVIRLKFY